MTRTCNQVPASPAAYLAQDGWIVDAHGMTRKPKLVLVEHNFEPGPCPYDQQHIDKDCPADCPRRAQGESNE